MLRVLTALAITVTALAATFGSTVGATAQANEAAVVRKLYDLGYPTDQAFAVQRWRADTRRTATGPLTAEERAALLAQPDPEHLAAMVGNPFTGMGLAVKHKLRAEAEQEAIRLCKAQGGGSSCTRPLVTRADQCVAIVGYQVTINRRPHYRTSVAVSGDVTRSLAAANDACPAGASHPELCRPLLTYCGDGRDLQLFEDGKPVERSAEATTATR
jgi:hypothetical protein